MSGDLQGSDLVVLTVCVARWYVLDAETTDLVAIHTDGNEQLSVMRFSRGELGRPVTLDQDLLDEPLSHKSSSPVCRWRSAGGWISRQLHLPVHRLRQRTQIQPLWEVHSE